MFIVVLSLINILFLYMLSQKIRQLTSANFAKLFPFNTSYGKGLYK